MEVSVHEPQVVVVLVLVEVVEEGSDHDPQVVVTESVAVVVLDTEGSEDVIEPQV